jgi:phosphate starvation-inducible PhoH-like protein
MKKNTSNKDIKEEVTSMGNNIYVADNIFKFGPGSSNIKILSDILGFKVSQRGNLFFFPDKDPDLANLGKKAASSLDRLPIKGEFPTPWEVECLGALLNSDPDIDVDSFFMESPAPKGSVRKVIARTLAQKEYIEAIRNNHLTFGLGPAGTGKTYLAVAMAVEALIQGDVKRIILTRPAVEAGERLGFLPGDLADKVNPYLRPLFDALTEFLPEEYKPGAINQSGSGNLSRQNNLKPIKGNQIEVAPLAFMRGRTLARAFVILDEAQNTSREQLKMFLTRMGPGTKAVVTADPGQSDLPGGEPSGLIEAEKILSGIKGIAFCYFSQGDSVRHHLVRDILAAYEKHAPDKMSKATLKDRENSNNQSQSSKIAVSSELYDSIKSSESLKPSSSSNLSESSKNTSGNKKKNKSHTKNVKNPEVKPKVSMTKEATLDTKSLDTKSLDTASIDAKSSVTEDNETTGVLPEGDK